MKTETNIIKIVCKALSFTYAQLAEQIGYTEGALKTTVSTDKISNSMKKSIELYLKTIKREDLISQEQLEVENENIVKNVCDELNLSQRELAEILGVSKPTVERWSSSGGIPDNSLNHIKLLLENKRLTELLNKNKILERIKDFDFNSLSFKQLEDINTIIDN